MPIEKISLISYASWIGAKIMDLGSTPDFPSSALSTNIKMRRTHWRNRMVVQIFKDYKKKELVGQGEFIQYGVDFEEFESGAGNYSTALVLMKDGTVENVPVTTIKFVEEQLRQQPKNAIQLTERQVTAVYDALMASANHLYAFCQRTAPNNCRVALDILDTASGKL